MSNPPRLIGYARVSTDDQTTALQLDALRAAPGLGPFMARSAGARLGIELAVFAAFLQCALPPALALFPQTGTIRAAELEPSFQSRVHSVTGKPMDVYFYNKGL